MMNLNMDPRYKCPDGWYQRMKRAGRFDVKMVLKVPPEDAVDTDSSSAQSDEYVDVLKVFGNETRDWPDSNCERIVDLSKFVLNGNPTVMVWSLYFLSKQSFDKQIHVHALKSFNGVQVVINMLEHGDMRMKFASLRCLQVFALTKLLKYEIVYYGGLKEAIKLLLSPSLKLRCEAVKVIGLVAVFHRAWKVARREGAISLLSYLLDIPPRILHTPQEQLPSLDKDELNCAIESANALFQLCQDKKNTFIFWRKEGLRLCIATVKTENERLLVHITQLLHSCARKRYFREAIRTSHELMTHIRESLLCNKKLLKRTAIETVFQTAEDKEAREFFGRSNLMAPLVNLLNSPDTQADKSLMLLVTGALWRCAKSPENVTRMQQRKVVENMCQLLPNQPQTVQANIVGCLGICIQTPELLALARKNGLIELLTNMWWGIHVPLVKNVLKAITVACYDNESMILMDRMYVVPMIWGLLNEDNLAVVSFAGKCLAHLLRNMNDPVRFFNLTTDGVDIVCFHLQSPYTAVQTPMCMLISAMCQEPEIIGYLNELHIVEILSKLIMTKCKKLRYYLCVAIGACCPYEDNRTRFVEYGVVNYLLKFLKSKYLETREAACCAIYEFTVKPSYCAMIYRSPGIVKILIETLNSNNPDVQMAAARSLLNIRYFALVRDGTVPDAIEQRILDAYMR